MKNLVIGAASFIVILLLLLSVYTLQGREARNEEIHDGLSNAMRAAGEQLKKNGFYENDTAFEAAFVENLMQELDSASNVEVTVLKADHEKGSLSAEVTETFLHPNGKEGKASCKRTFLLEKENPVPKKKCYTAKFYTEKEMGEETSYKTVILPEGKQIKATKPPEKKGFVFAGWKSVKSGQAADFPLTMSGSEEFYAIWRQAETERKG